MPTLADPLPSWLEGSSKRAILQFVERAQAVPPDERIAVFDNSPICVPMGFARTSSREAMSPSCAPGATGCMACHPSR